MVQIPHGDNWSGFWESLSANATRFRLSKPYNQSAFVRIAVGSIADAVKSVEGSVTDPKSEKPIANPLNDLFDNPNNYLNREQFFEATSILWDVYGGVFWILEGVGNKPIARPGAEVKAIYPVPHDMFSPNVDDVGRLQSWKYSYGRASVDFKTFQVVRFFDYNPYAIYSAANPLDACSLELQSDHSAAVWNMTYFENGANPGVVLKYIGKLRDEQKEQARTSFKDRFSGPDKNGEPFVMDDQGDIVEFGGKHVDMQFLELRKFSRDVIFAIYGVPLVIAGFTEDVNYATHLGQEKVFWKKTVLPRLRAIEGGIQQAFGVWYHFDSSDVEALREEWEDTATTAGKMIAQGIPPITTYAMLGKTLKPEWWLKTWFKPMNAVDVQEEPDEGPSFSDLDESPAPAPAKSFNIEEKAASKASRRKTVHSRLIRTVMAPGERRVFRAYGRYLTDIEKRVLARLRELSINEPREFTRKAIDPDALNLDEDAMFLELQRILMPQLELIGESALEATAGELEGIAFNVNDPRWGEFFERKALKLKSIPKTLQKNLKTTIRKGIDGNLTVDEITRSIRDQFKVERAVAARIARTETAMSVNGVRDMTFAAEGVTKQSWSTAQDEKVRATHRQLGTLPPQIIPHDWGQNIGSYNLYFPGDPRGEAKEVINCRCIALPED